MSDEGGVSHSRFRYSAYLSSVARSSSSLRFTDAPSVTAIPLEELAQLGDGDVVHIDGSGVVTQLWSMASLDNVILVTNTCNCRCIMCPQPPSRDHEDLLSFNKRILKLANVHEESRITFTGGEPTTALDSLLQLLRLCERRFPQAATFLLTNARRLGDSDVTKRLVAAKPDLTYCIPLYSDIDAIHDRVVGVKGAFAETVRALHNLALLNQRVELRVVVQRANFRRLPQFAEFVYRNLPFVSHVAFMGLETTGLANEHINAVWIEPIEYMDALGNALVHLHQRDLDVSIYNLPLCLVPKTLWGFARDSISGWKKSFLPICAGCTMREQCPGLFSTSQVQSARISPLL